MTEAELNAVRELKKQILNGERQLKTLRTAAENLVPVIDGMPHARSQSSRVAKIVTLILDAEQSLNALKENLDSMSTELVMKIRRAPLTTREQEILILRYVACMNFLDIEGELHLSDARIFYHHRQALNKMRVWQE